MARPKGYTDWTPKPHVAVVLDQVQGVLSEYRNYLPMTVRQIFYRLVGAYGFEKTEKAYKRLADYLVLARRARIIPFSSIRDDGTTQIYDGGYWQGPSEFLDGIRRTAEGYEIERMQDQEMRVEVWCEAAGMAPQLGRVASPYGIRVYSTGGFSSVTVTYELGRRVGRSSAPTHVLHVGDFDPSGVSLYEAMTEDAGLFAAAHGGRLIPVRVALTEDQVEEHEIPTAPPKASDSRSANWWGETAQAEAMPPDLLAETLRTAIEETIDLDVYRETVEREAEERERLVEKFEAIDWDGDDE